MNLQELLEKRIIQKVEPNRELALNTFKVAERDLETSRELFEERRFDWALSIAYNSMLQSGRALMFLNGFRPFSEYKHVAVIEFVRAFFKNIFSKELLYAFNKMRKKRHLAVYEETGLISEQEARQAVSWAQEFFQKTKQLLSK